MKTNFKLFVILNVIAWMLLISCIVAAELLLLNQSMWEIVGGVALALIVSLHLYLFYSIAKNRKRINLLKEQYINSLKPVAPIRFCPTDEELIEQYHGKVVGTENETQTNEEQNKDTIEKTPEEEESELI